MPRPELKLLGYCNRGRRHAGRIPDAPRCGARSTRRAASPHARECGSQLSDESVSRTGIALSLMGAGKRRAKWLVAASSSMLYSNRKSRTRTGTSELGIASHERCAFEHGAALIGALFTLLKTLALLSVFTKRAISEPVRRVSQSSTWRFLKSR